MREAQCHCGATRFQLSGDPLTCYTCHCHGCQSESGSAFTLSMLVNSDDVQVTQGKLEVNCFEKNGAQVERHHCGQCGSTLWFTAEPFPGIRALKAGVFNDATGITPIAHLWLESAQPWVSLNDGLAQYQKQPPMSELFALWAASKETELEG